MYVYIYIYVYTYYTCTILLLSSFITPLCAGGLRLRLVDVRPAEEELAVQVRDVDGVQVQDLRAAEWPMMIFIIMYY